MSVLHYKRIIERTKRQIKSLNIKLEYYEFQLEKQYMYLELMDNKNGNTKKD